MTPHVTAELWELRHPGESSVHLQRWPDYDPDLVRQETVTMVIQLNGIQRYGREEQPHADVWD